MTELELCDHLGLLLEPTKNRVVMNEDLENDIAYVNLVFAEATLQKSDLGPVQQDLWLELIPWHSLN